MSIVTGETTGKSLIIPLNNLSSEGTYFFSVSSSFSDPVSSSSVSSKDKLLSDCSTNLSVSMDEDLSGEEEDIEEILLNQELLSRIKNNDETLIELNLEYKDIDGDGAEALANALLSNDTLIFINLGNNNIDNQGVKALAGALRNNTTLTSLVLEGNDIGEEGAKYIADALRNNTTLIGLVLEGNDIGDKGAKYIADVLRNNATLTNLCLDECGIGELGNEYLVNALIVNKTLSVFYFRGYNIVGNGLVALMNMLRCNMSLIELKVDVNINDEEINWNTRGRIDALLKRNQDLADQLLFAINQENIVQVEELLECGVNPNSFDEDHNTTMHLAVMKNNIQIVELLLGYNASLLIRNEDEKTPLDLATDNSELLNLLRDQTNEN